MHAFNSPDLFSRKSGFWGKNRGTTTEDTMYAKRTPEEILKVRYINIFIYSQFLLLLIYINTFPLTFIEDSMVEGKSHTTWPTESNSRDIAGFLNDQVLNAANKFYNDVNETWKPNQMEWICYPKDMIE